MDAQIEENIIADAVDPQPLPVDIDDTNAMSTAPIRSTKLCKCHACHTTFLTEIDLISHHLKFPQHATSEGLESKFDPSPPRSDSKAAKITMKHLLASQPIGPCPESAKMYQCPLCQEYVDRKALVNHLRKINDVPKSDDFPFDPIRDMHQKHLACKYYHAQFTMEIALCTHFQRASCPVLLCSWINTLS